MPEAFAPAAHTRVVELNVVLAALPAAAMETVILVPAVVEKFVTLAYPPPPPPPPPAALVDPLPPAPTHWIVLVELQLEGTVQLVVPGER